MSQSQTESIGGQVNPTLKSSSSNPIAARHAITAPSPASRGSTPSVSSSLGAPAERNETASGGSKRAKGNRVSKILGKAFKTRKRRNINQGGQGVPQVISTGTRPGSVKEIPAVSSLRRETGLAMGAPPSSAIVTEAPPAVGNNSLGEMISKFSSSEVDQKKDTEDYEKLAAKLGGRRLILQELKEIAGASEFLAPFKAFFGLTDSVLKMMEAVEASERKWKGVRDDIVDHLTYVRNDLKGNSSTKALGSDSPRIRYLKEYAEELTGVFNAYLLERGLCADDVTQKNTVFTEYVKEVGRFFKKASTVTLDADKTASLQGRLTKAFQNYERSKTTYIADRQFELWDAKIAELLRGDRPQQAIGGKAAESAISPSGIQHSKCHQHTRIGIREAINKWAETSEGPPIYLICDYAGMGKSTVAYHLACGWHETSHLAASFFFSRGTASTSTFSDLIRHVAGRLWRRIEVKNHPDMTYDYVVDALDESRSVEEQWQRLVLRPLSILASVSVGSSRPFLLVVDAVDECSKSSREAFLHSLKELLNVDQSLYGRVKVLLTARREPDIMNALKNSTVNIEELRQHTTDGADVDIYIGDRFKDMRLSTDDAQRLAKYADGLFIFAATACDLLKESKARIRLLNGILHDPKYLHMDRLTALYMNILKMRLETDIYSKEAIQNILRIILAATRPLLVSEIEQLLFGEGVDVAGTVEDFQSVLGGGYRESPVYIRHPTFREFMLDSKVSGDYGGFTIESAHQLLSLRCLTTMKRELKFNICNLETSCLPNAEIRGLENRVHQKIPNALKYSCMHWSSHLCYDMNPVNTESLALIEEFFTGERLLFWLEVLSVLGTVRIAIFALRQVKACVKKFRDAVRKLVDEALRFVLAFYTPISTSAPHIYLSALPFLPTESSLWKHTRKSFTNLFDVHKGRMHSWATRPIAWRGHAGCVTTIACSPDGRHVVSGSNDNTIRIWDMETGATVGEPLTGHTGALHSVAYSPDGLRVVSGSDDGTIRIWDAETGAAVGEPLTGHRSRVSSVAYSPDGRHVVSGSNDYTIRIWDAETGAAMGEPRKGHESHVSSVAYSSDGRHVVSGSWDRTIRMWDAETGAVVGEPLTGHTLTVRSVAYSPDGRYIASGSDDRTLRIWDAETGAAVGEPLMGHTDRVQSVAYSPDGRHIASGSEDHAIRIWDAETGAAVAGPLAGHTSWVFGVAYSPEGRHVVSCSNDQTVRIWDAETGAAVGEPLTEHTDWVHSFACSPDGRHVVSGSHDSTIRIWDVETGRVVGEPLTGHTGNVNSVTYSPDGRHIASGSGDCTVRIWDPETGAAVGELLTGHESHVYSVTYSPDGRHVAVGSHGNTIRIWDPEKGAVVRELLMGHIGDVIGVAYSPDGRHVVSCSTDNTIRIWDAETGAVVGEPLTGHTGWVQRVACSPDGQHIVSCSNDQKIRIWDAGTGAAVGEPLTGHTGPVYSVTYSPDGRHIVSGSGDRTIRIWDAEKGVAVGVTLTGHTGWVLGVAYSPDGRHVVSGSSDNTIRIWDQKNEIDDDDQGIVPRPINRSTRIADNSISASHPSVTSLSNVAIPTKLLHPNGWVCDGEELLFWVPEDCRNGLTCPAIMTIPNTGRHRAVRLDFTHFRYGIAWTEVYRRREGGR